MSLAFDTSTDTDEPGIERLAVPHTFNKGLGLGHAFVAVMEALLRILMSCFLFTAWGVLAIWSWAQIGSGFWRWAMLVSVVALFVSTFLALMIGISLGARAVMPKKS